MPFPRTLFLPFISILLAVALTGCGNTLPVRQPTDTSPYTAAQDDTPEQADSESTPLLSLGTGTEFEVPTPETHRGLTPRLQAPDLWDRIRRGYRLKVPANRRVEQEIKWIAAHPDYLKRVRQRARPYLHFIVEEVEKRHMPTELVLLPVVESAFQPFAYSPGRASGIWQFIPSTGRMYGLKQNWWYEGRRDVVAATRAALDYLKSLAARFDGDWELALAAYNTGASNVRRAIRNNQKRGKATDFWSLDLPRETKGYVPRLLAVAKVVAAPEHYGVILESVPDQPYFSTVDIGSQLDLALAADMAGIPIDELYLLNPGFNRWATDPEGPHRLNLPLDRVKGFNARLARLDPGKRLRWERYRIRSGDNLGRIANRHGTTVQVLKQANRLKGNRIRAGKHLLIPLSNQPAEHYALSSGQRLARLQSSNRSGNKITHTVQPGDNLWDIARSYRVGHKTLARWNGISPKETLHPGQKLVVWTKNGGKSRNGKVASLTIDPPPDTTPRRNALHYRVRKGDSLSRIAQRFRIKVADLKKWNTLPGKYLQPGQRLQLYVKGRY